MSSRVKFLMGNVLLVQAVPQPRSGRLLVALSGALNALGAAPEVDLYRFETVPPVWPMASAMARAMRLRITGQCSHCP